jgi:hypothetical protein
MSALVRRSLVPLVMVTLLIAPLLAIVRTDDAVAYHTPHRLPRGYDVQRIDDPTQDRPNTGMPGSTSRYGHFGDGVVNAGDVDGDGVDDVLVGADQHGGFGNGDVHIFSGVDGSLLRTIPAPDPEDHLPGQNGDGFGTYVGKLADIGSCPGFEGGPGDDCSDPAIGDRDGVSDHLVTAIGVDVDASGDNMGTVYVLDGATGAVLKRIQMPAADRAVQAANAPNASQGGGFGRTVLNPSGQPPCGGFGGLGSCDHAAASSVAIGDLDGDTWPDIVVGASDFPETTDSNPVCDDGSGNGFCFQAGRFYVYSGADIAGSDPAQSLDQPMYTIKNPFAEHDSDDVNSRFHREAMGYSVAPVGDLGACNDTTPIDPGDDPRDYLCLNATNNTTAPDGKPEFIASSHRSDYGGMSDVGLAMAIDGPTGRILDIYRHPEPQPTSIFAFSNYNQPAIGDVGSSLRPDVYQGAMIQTVGKKAQGRGYVMSGDLRAGGSNHYNFSVLDDPTPSKIGNFGTSSAGVGDLTGDSRNEIMIGAYGPHAPQVVDDVISDVHIFSALTDEALQTIPDPDQQPGSGFGRALAPLGDLNGDNFLDFAVGAGLFDHVGFADGGRVYIFRSNDAPPSAGRGITLELRRHLVARGRVTTDGPDACRAGVTVRIKRGSKTVARVVTNERGVYRGRIPDRPGWYRAIAPRVVRDGVICRRALSERVLHRH